MDWIEEAVRLERNDEAGALQLAETLMDAGKWDPDKARFLMRLQDDAMAFGAKLTALYKTKRLIKR